MPHRRHQPNILTTMEGNPLKTLLDGLKTVNNICTDGSNSSIQFPLSESGSMQPTPQMLVPNNSVLIGNIPHSINSTQFHNQPSSSIPTNDQVPPPFIRNANEGNRIVKGQSQFTMINGPSFSGQRDSQQSRPPGPPPSTHLPHPPPLSHVTQPPPSSQSHQPHPKQPPPTSHQPSRQSQPHNDNTAPVFNQLQIVSTPQQMKPVRLQQSSLVKQQPSIYFTTQAPYGMPVLGMGNIQPAPHINNSSPQISSVSTGGIPNNFLTSNHNDQSNFQPPPIPASNLNQPNSSISDNQIPLNGNQQSCSPLSNVQYNSLAFLLNTNEKRSIESQVNSGVQESDKINHVLTGFRQMLQNRARNQNISMTSANNSNNSQPSEQRHRNEGNSVDNNVHMFAAPNKDGNCRVIRVSTYSTNDEHQLNPVVKKEYIEIDEEDDDCMLTSVDLSKRIFVLQKKHHNAVIDLIHDDDDDNSIVMAENEPVLKKERGETHIVSEMEPMETVNDKGDDVEILVSSTSDIPSTQVVEKVMSGKSDDKKGGETIAQTMEKDVIDSNQKSTTLGCKKPVEGQEATKASPTKRKDQTLGKERQIMNLEANKTLPHDGNAQNSSANMHQFMNVLGNILHSMKGNEVTKSAPKTGVVDEAAISKHNKKISSTRKLSSEKQDKQGSASNCSRPASGGSKNEEIGFGDDEDIDEENNSNKIVADVTTKLMGVSPSTCCKNSKATLSEGFEKASCSVSKCVATDSSSKETSRDDGVKSTKNIPNKLKGKRKKRGVKRRKMRKANVTKHFKADEGSKDEENGASSREKTNEPSTKMAEVKMKATNSGKKASGINLTKNVKMQEIVTTSKDSVKINTIVAAKPREIKLNPSHTKSMEKQKGADKLEKSLSSANGSMSESTESDSNSSDDDDSSSSSSLSDSSDDDADVEYKCKLCSKSLSRKSQLKKHMKTHYNGEVKKIRKKIACKGCRRKFSDETVLQAHLLKRRYCFFDSTRTYWRKKGSSVKACRMCGKGQAKWKDLKKHSYRDLTCRLRFISLVLERTKQRSKHQPILESSSNEKCGNDSQIMNHQSEKLKENLKGRHDERETSKDIQQDVERVFSKSHAEMSSSSEDKPLCCQSCQEVFQTPLLFRGHLNKIESCKMLYSDPKTISPIKLNYCPLCSIFMPSHSKLLSHVCNGRATIVRCSECNRVFNDAFCLKRHHQMSNCMQTSTPIDDIETEDVLPSAASKKVEEAHKQVCKSKSNQFDCLLCGKSFHQIQEMLDHSHLHTDEGKYVCQDCGMIFERYNRLVSHMIWHRRKLDLIGENQMEEEASVSCPNEKTMMHTSRGEVVKCPKCPIRFKSGQNFNVHMTKHTSKKLKLEAASVIRIIKRANMISASDDTKFSCSLCGLHFTTLSGRNDHIKTCGSKNKHEGDSANDNHLNVQAKVKSKGPRAAKFVHTIYKQCSLCSKVLKKQSFYDHLNAHKKYIISDIKNNSILPQAAPCKAICVICQKVYSSNKNLIRHIGLHKAEEIRRPLIKCEKPPESCLRVEKWKLSGFSSSNLPSQSPTKSEGTIKRKIAKITYSFSCKVCNKNFSNIPTFKFHLKIAHKHLKNVGWVNYVNYLQDSKQPSDSLEESVTPSKSNSSNVDKGREGTACEICKKVVQRRNLPKHMHDVHGLPAALFYTRRKKSSAVNIKKESASIATDSTCNESQTLSFPRIEVDMGGVNITPSSSKKLSAVNKSEQPKKCPICEESFSHRKLLWKHLFIHIKPSYVRLIRLEDIIKEVPENFSHSGVSHLYVNGTLDSHTENIAESMSNPVLNVGIADGNTPISFDDGPLSITDVNAAVSTVADTKFANKR